MQAFNYPLLFSRQTVPLGMIVDNFAESSVRLGALFEDA